MFIIADCRHREIEVKSLSEFIVFLWKERWNEPIKKLTLHLSIARLYRDVDMLLQS